MYFPFLRSRQEEMLATIEAIPLIVGAKNIVPIIEPVNDCSKRLERILDGGLSVCVIVNPQHGDFSGRSAPPKVMEQLVRGNSIAALRIGTSTSVRDIRSFVGTHPHSAFVICGRLSSTAVGEIEQSAAKYIIFAEHSSRPTIGMRRERCVQIVDRFARKGKNADYTDIPEKFSDRHMANDSRFGHFGDYSIVGDKFPKKGGGLAWAVALHHVYQNGPRRSAIYLRHILSDQKGFAGAVPAKTLEAIAKLVSLQPMLGRLSPDNDTPTTTMYQHLHNTGHNPGLGKMKRYAIRHHLELMSRVLA